MRLIAGAIALAVVVAPALTTKRAGATAGATSRPAVTAACDPIDASQCLLPYPDDYFTVHDSSTATGLRLHLTAASMPQNSSGVPIDPTDIDRSDGFSPGSAIIVFVPGIDLAVTGAAPITDIARSLDRHAPIVLLDTVTHRRVPYWAEMDTWNGDPATQAVVIRPAADFTEGHRIVVALRDLKRSDGSTIPASAAFAALRDHLPINDPALRARRPAIDRVLVDAARTGVTRQHLYLAWDFTVASARGLAGGMLHMRDDAYASLGHQVPAFQVTSVDDNVSTDVMRLVQGTFDVPQYLTGDGSAGSRLVLGANGLPVRNGTYHAEFRCIIPWSVVAADGSVQRARGVVYGHGLLGSTSEIDGFGSFANQYRIVLCATPWIGMASDDIGNVVNALSDFSNFGSIPDRLQQALLNFQFLARLLKDPRGFDSDPAFRAGTANDPVVQSGEVFFNGNSQGGILGGAATAISKEWVGAVLGVPGMNYSELLPRSVDFDVFKPLLSAAYDQQVQTLALQLVQILWDRGDADGYAQHMINNPYPGTPRHRVLMIEAFGDHQVANIATETEARTIGAHVREPAIAPGRSNDVTPFWGISSIPVLPFGGSVLELWDFGTPAPPTASLPPEPPQYGSDPHGAARNVPAVQAMVSQFLQQPGSFVDVCGTDPCRP